MNPILNIATNEFDNNYLFLNDKYEERIFNWHKTGGPGRYANYYFKLIPNQNKEIVVFFDVNLESSYINALGERLNDYVSGLAIDKIELSGFNVYIEKQKFHPVDSRPDAYSMFFIQSLDNLIESNVFIPKTRKANLSGERFNIKIDKPFLEHLPSDDEVSSIFVPRLHETSIRLNSIYKISPVGDEEIENMLEYTICPASGNQPSKINLIFKTNLLTTNEKVKYYKIINRVILNLRDESLNVLGFTIYFETKTVKELKLKTDEFQRFEWALRNLFNCQDSIQKINEGSR